MTRPRRDDGWRDGPTFLGLGAAHGIGGGERGDVVGRLLVPDPEARHGWREWYVRAPAPEPRPIGFRGPGAR